MSQRSLLSGFYWLLVFGLFLPTTIRAQTTFTVTSTATNTDANPGDGLCDIGDGSCTLLAAFQEANATAALDVIAFDVPQSDAGYNEQSGVFSFRPSGAMIALQPVTVDGSTQPEFDGLPVIEISGTNATGTGLDIRADRSTIHAVSVVLWTGPGVMISADSITVTGSLLGTDRNSSPGLGNGWGINSSGTTGTVIGSTAAANRNVISGNNNGITADSWSNSTIIGNRIGTDIAGVVALPNSQSGVSFLGVGGLTIGGTEGVSVDSCTGACNLISGNGWNGINAGGGAGSGATILGNYIGLDVTGESAIANGREGVSVSGGNGTVTIGGPSADSRNVISGNTLNGIRVFGTGAAVIEGNRIGTNDAGTTAVPNLLDGINVSSTGNRIGDTTAGAGNVISGNVGAGIRRPSGGGLEVYGNLIGLDAAGENAVPNQDWGIVVSATGTMIGSGTAEGRNVVSGNAVGGIQLNGDDNTVRGNYVGTNASGSVAVANVTIGVRVLGGFRSVIGGSGDGDGNVVSGNGTIGIHLQGADGTVAGNLVGLAATGDFPIANGASGMLVEGDGNTVGGAEVGDGNVVSGNAVHGIEIAYPFTTNLAVNNRIVGNFIGTDGSLTTTIANGGSGVIAGFQAPDNTIDGNYIVGNSAYGISAVSSARRTIITNNIIGLLPDLVTPAPNASGGVFINTDGTLVGGEASGGNLIAFNGGPGVTVVTGTIGGLASGFGNEIRGNSIYANDAIGIDLGASPDGVTLNDVLDTDSNFGGNRQQNHPVITSSSGAPLQIGGYLNSAPSRTFRVDLFANESCDASSWGEGQQYLGSTDVTTDANGNGTFDVVLPDTALVGTRLTATATADPDGTSEFGPCVRMDAADIAVAKTVAPDPVVVTETLTYSISVWNDGPAGATDVQVTDTLPPGFAPGGFVSGAQECEIDEGILFCVYGTLAAADTAKVVLEGSFAAAGVATNTASAFAAQDDENRNNNAATVTVQILNGAADMAITTFDPAELVGELPDTLTISGQGFETGATVVLQPTDQQGEDNTGPLAGEVLSVTADQVVVALDIPDEMWVGAYDVVVTNPGGSSTRRPILILPHLAYPAVRGAGALAFPIGIEKSNYLEVVNIGPDDGIIWVEIYPPDPDAIALKVFDPAGRVIWDGATAEDPTIVALMLDLDSGESIRLRTSWRVDPAKVIFPETVALAKHLSVADVGFNSSQTVSWEATRGHAKGQMKNILKSVMLGGVCRSIGQKFAGLDVSILDSAIDAAMDVLKERGAMRPEDILQEVGEALGEHLIPGFGQVVFAAEIGACVGEILKGISDTIKIKAKGSADRLRKRHGSTKRAKDALLDKVLKGGASARFRLQAALEIEKQMDKNPCNPHLADRNKYKGWVRGPWDPNDKVTNADFVCEYGMVDGEVRCVRYYVPLAASETPITYTVLFENKADAGADATFVTVVDELPGELDPTTLEVLSSSHDEVLSVDVTGQTATFTFTNIGLPPNVTAPEGEGYVQFAVTPRIGLMDGTEIRNDASIVFDFNPAIETPEVIHEIRAIADVQTLVAVSVDSLLTDSVVTVNYSLTNAGPDNASDVQFGLLAGIDTQVLGVESSTVGCTVDAQSATCALGDLWVGAGSTVTVTATRSSIGFVELDAAINIAETDGDPGDNAFKTRINYYGSVGVERVGGDVPGRHEILPSYPNPFSRITTLEFNVASRADVEVIVFDVAGRRVATVVDAVVDAGRYSVAFDGSRLASGVYFVNARIGDYLGSRKVVVVR